MSEEPKYLAIGALIMGYLPKDWELLYIDATYEQIVQEYKKHTTPEKIDQTIAELEDLCQRDWSEEKLQYLINEDMYGGVDPSQYDMTWHQWLTHVLNILKT